MSRSTCLPLGIFSWNFCKPFNFAPLIDSAWAGERVVLVSYCAYAQKPQSLSPPQARYGLDVSGGCLPFRPYSSVRLPGFFPLDGKQSIHGRRDEVTPCRVELRSVGILFWQKMIYEIVDVGAKLGECLFVLERQSTTVPNVYVWHLKCSMICDYMCWRWWITCDSIGTAWDWVMTVDLSG